MRTIKRLLRHTIRITGIAFFAYSGFMSIAAEYWGQHASLRTEVPIGRVEYLLVNDSGDVYVGSQPYSRIQVFDKHGNFLRGYSPGGLRGFEFSLVPESGLVVIKDGNGTYEMDDKTGVLVERSYEANIVAQGEIECHDKEGNQYLCANWSWLWPRIQKVSPQGKESIVVCQPWTLWIRQSPSPARYIAILGLVLVLITSLPEMRRKFRGYRNKRAEGRTGDKDQENHPS
jgi:hypothetical protein